MGGLLPEDIDGFVSGRLVLADLAAKGGVSKQAASKWLRRRSLGRSPTAPTASLGGAATTQPRAGVVGAPPSPTGAVASTMPRHPALLNLAHDPDALRAVAAGAMVAAIARSNLLLAGSEPLGPSGLKAVVAAVVAAAETLARLGALRLDVGDLDKPTELVVRVMTQTEVAELLAGHDADDQRMEGAESV